MGSIIFEIPATWLHTKIVVKLIEKNNEPIEMKPV